MTDERLEQIVGNLLRAGVVSAAAVVLTGGVWRLAVEGFAQPHYGHFRPDVLGVRSLGGLALPDAIILVGLLALIATPLARVVFTLAAFALRRDWMYVAITAIVLIVLLYSIGTSWL
ncbi:MAG: DUF1634 domain-containing protein [Acidobacteriia bacterium]|nr:DUF1634 domain-containing protein [Terriglobia bacterium]